MPPLISSVWTAESQASSIGSSGMANVLVLHLKSVLLEYLPLVLVTDRNSSNLTNDRSVVVLGHSKAFWGQGCPLFPANLILQSRLARGRAQT
jgi:hypothetical protein